jgi:hypothetical protein
MSRRQVATQLLLAWSTLVALVILVGVALTGPLARSVGADDDDAERSIAEQLSTPLTAVAQRSACWANHHSTGPRPILLIVTWGWLRQRGPVLFLAVAPTRTPTV